MTWGLPNSLDFTCRIDFAGSYRCALRPEYTIVPCETNVGGRHTHRTVGSITGMTVTATACTTPPLIQWLDSLVDAGRPVSARPLPLAHKAGQA